MSRSVEIAALGGLLHDIGKLFRQGGGKHDELGAEIAGDVLSKSQLPPDLIADACNLIELHHDQEPPRDVDNIPFYAIKFADWISANYREEEEINADKHRVPSHVIDSPFSNIGGRSGEHWDNIYNWTRDTVKRVLGEVASTRNSVPDVLLGLKTAIYSPPIFVVSDAKQDAKIPLSVHSHLVSAIASALAASESFRSAVNRVNRDREKGLPTAALAEKLSEIRDDVIELVAMDIHGIQRFIYSFTSERKAMRTAAGRSMIVSILSRAIPAIVADVYGVYPTNVLINSGGRALLILPAKGADLEQLSADITRSLWKNNIDVVVSLKSVHIQMSELFEPLASAQSGEPVSKVLQKKIDDLWNKLHTDSFSVYLKGKLIDEFRSTAVSVAEDSKQICSRCGAVVQGDPYCWDEEVLCTACQIAEGIQSWWIGKGASPLNLTISSTDREYLLKAETDSIVIEKPSQHTFRFRTSVDSLGGQGILTDIPRAFEYRVDENNSILSLEDMGSFFAVAKGDGDSMGMLFGELASESIAKYVAFSWAMSYYFEYYLPDLLRDEEKDLQVHLVYAGGDDFIFVGKPLHVLEAVRNTLLWFEDYKHYGNVTRTLRSAELFKLLPSVSTGFALFPQKYKMLWAINNTEELLHAAKQIASGPNAQKQAIGEAHSAHGPQIEWKKAGLCVQSEDFVAPLSEIGKYIDACKTMLANLGDAGNVTSTAFYKLVDRLYRIIRASNKEKIDLGDVKLYAESKHYINRLQKRVREQSMVVERANGVLKNFLGGSVGESAKGELLAPFIPFVLTYLLLKDMSLEKEV